MLDISQKDPSGNVTLVFLQFFLSDYKLYHHEFGQYFDN